ncbi:flavin-containing monooxygenase FMO GS-OX-like 4 isoform X2 [Harmonia axyridis]|nr:flavin-containing monooxygenase FMO GS-OX-like 4 isoform X2 [Harmonia axyridis]XP_045459987.1 flavin-containing monooxygenase FMO GS-OX-like 4 isoform X2 [Harmonia axyridis]XP_045459988.1 flavin-containing monooxygenase FMO GS-OX-like 4 isoform X2 [Harmonia axyridis]
MRIAVIGAGASGLVAIKYCIQDGHDCEAFEQTESLGGTWNYTDDVGLDKNGLPIHTSMYKHLRTNLPKELMLFDDFQYPEGLKESFISQNEVLQYLNNYADKMNLRKYIRFLTQVTYVQPIDDNKWDIEIQDVISKEKIRKIFDAVICCNGKYSVPYMPHIPGLDSFSGNCIHSHNYRSEEPYRDKTVLVIGAGPSGVDICSHLSRVAKKVLLSMKSSPFFKASYGIVEKVPLKEIIGKKGVFEDQSIELIDDIIMCTGYVYNYPFLSEKCQITVDDNYVRGLYKEIVCVEYPTLIVMGIPGRICPFPTFGLQMRFVMKMLKGEYHLPSREKMIKEIQKEREDKNCANRHFHNKGVEGELMYWIDLAESANVEGIPKVFSKLHAHVIQHKRDVKKGYRILNEEEFQEYDI